MTVISLKLTDHQVDVIQVLAFLDERRSVGRVGHTVQVIVDEALAAAEEDPDVRAALRARRRRPLSLVPEVHDGGQS